MSFAKSIIVIAVLFGTSFAQADQCSWNNKSVAQRARQFLAYYPGAVYTMCEPCGDKTLSQVVYGQDKQDTLDKRAVHFRRQTGGDYVAGEVSWQLILNGDFADQGISREIDLAYTFIKGENGYVNVGTIFACLDNDFWNPEKLKTFSGNPQQVSPWLPLDHKTSVDVSEDAFLDAYADKYPNDPKG